eukprot:5053775-Lingulodinium_polyedra.AAC.1
MQRSAIFEFTRGGHEERVFAGRVPHRRGQRAERDHKSIYVLVVGLDVVCLDWHPVEDNQCSISARGARAQQIGPFVLSHRRRSA